MSNPPRKRRERTAFHHKVDEDLTPADRGPYLALLLAPRTRVDDAHAWLRARGYAPSRSAVARHRRRFLLRHADHEAALIQADRFARLAGGPGAPDFAAAAEVQLQHLVFRHLLALDAPPGANDEQAGEAHRRLDPAELLRLSKLVSNLVELTRLRLQRDHAAGPSPDTGRPVPKRDEDLRREIGEILGMRLEFVGDSEVTKNVAGSPAPRAPDADV